ncbi:cyclin-domain-containing protein [Cokeromyces recurvatus]|uniref:cyclin-domain-containing protein n=1 Tax=Cokeromyces recurvatus TaxID=90255 RepID=UPI002220D604|nr:cyclin-domain-containing protein [Cokeromyces recurvatus]KAI7905241.1 cyclin-domain-containing protein [Cokeromyces recurvatus]
MNHQSSDTLLPERSFMIDKLLHVSADFIDSIWFNKQFSSSSSTINKYPTVYFIREILKRTKATYAMLQLALFYIFRIRTLVYECIFKNSNDFVCCSRRMFIASLMISSKYLNDKNYRNRTWAKFTNLPVKEINTAELIFLKLINYQLYVSKPVYDKWIALLHDRIQRKSDPAMLARKHFRKM